VSFLVQKGAPASTRGAARSSASQPYDAVIAEMSTPASQATTSCRRLHRRHVDNGRAWQRFFRNFAMARQLRWYLCGEGLDVQL
jgi:hypothetical protein